MAIPAVHRQNMKGSEAIEQHADIVSLPLQLLACPVCAPDELSLTVSSSGLSCPQCSTHYPLLGCGEAYIPWLFSQPDNSRLEWKARYNGLLHANSAEQKRLRYAHSVKNNSEIGRQRISQLKHAHEQHRSQLIELLAPLDFEEFEWSADAAGLLHSKLPRNQGLSSYTSNIFRDWAWNNGENDALIDALEQVLSADRRDSIGSLLTLGAGACRLSYDMHRRYSPDLSVILDHNPLLLQIAGQVIQGEDVSLYEFPIAPLNAASFAVLQKCHAPDPLRDSNFYYLLADALNPPFVSGSFDTVVTPWLIDIIPQNLRTFIPSINRLLPRGGVWINTGSLAFFHRDESWCFSEEEVLEMVVGSGFEILASERRTVPYMQSPHSAHGRTEKILSFSARKVEDREPPAAYSYLPDWILDSSQPIPSSTESSVNSSNHLLIAQVLGAIDGKRTIDQIGGLVAKQYGLGIPETTHAVKRIFVDAWEDSAATRSTWSQ
jgi:uncharacterized protein YbaR (Trm112 family)